MPLTELLVDIHCHLLPGIDDGARSWNESLQMARIAMNDGIGAVIATPHQLGAFHHNRGEQIRSLTAELQQFLQQHRVDLKILPGADVRVEVDLCDRISRGDVITLGDHHKHVLLELPHEMYFSLEPCLDSLAAAHMTGILSHPERNQGLLRRPDLIGALVQKGCLMQITAGSLLGNFGSRCRELAEQIVQRGWAHFVATDAHGAKARRPLMNRAFLRVAEIAGEVVAHELCCRNPSLVARGEDVPPRITTVPKRVLRWLSWRKVG